MKRRVMLLTLAIAMLLSVVLLSGGCAQKVIYGTWQFKYTSYANGSEQNDALFPMVFDVRKNGEIYLLDTLFATYTRYKNTFSVTFVDDDSEDQDVITGAWEIAQTEDGTALYIYPDEQNVMYTLYRVSSDGQ